MAEVGKMRNCIELQKPEDLADRLQDDGSVLDTYVKVKDIWAEFKPQRGREVWTSDNQEAQQFLRFRVWFDEDITVETRAIFRGKAYNVKTSMDEEGMDEYMILEMTLAENKDPVVG